MRRPEKHRFIYSAYANSVGAVLHKPAKAFLTDVPCAALPVTGGLISQTKENITFGIDTADILRIGRATTTVLGEQRDNHFISLATASLEKLNILDVVTADRVVSKITSSYPVREESKFEEDVSGLWPSTFFLSGSYFDNLKIDGKHYECRIEEPEGDDGFRIRTAEKRCDPVCVEDCRHVHVPQFGTIHIGEKISYAGKVILTMLRIELGCPYDATVSGPQSGSNGTGAP